LKLHRISHNQYHLEKNPFESQPNEVRNLPTDTGTSNQQPVSPRKNPFETTTNQPQPITPSISVQPSSVTQGSSPNPPPLANVGNTQINTGGAVPQPQMFQIPQGATGQAYMQPGQMMQPGAYPYYYYPPQYAVPFQPGQSPTQLQPIQPGQSLTQLQSIQPGNPVYPTAGAYYYPYYYNNNPST